MASSTSSIWKELISSTYPASAPAVALIAVRSCGYGAKLLIENCTKADVRPMQVISVNNAGD